MLMDEYFSAMKGVLEKVEQTQRDTIIEVAEKIADRLAQGYAWHIMDTGHMLMFEGVGRTGGMMALKPITVLRRPAAWWAMTACRALQILCWGAPTCLPGIL